MKRRPHNNKMQLTRSGHSRWRPSQLILVLGGRSALPPGRAKEHQSPVRGWGKAATRTRPSGLRLKRCSVA